MPNIDLSYYEPYRYNSQALETLIQQWQKQAKHHSQNDQIPLLHAACYHGNRLLVRGLMEDMRTNLEQRDSDGRTPLWIAAYRKHDDIVEWLLDQDEVVHPNQAPDDGLSPLELSVTGAGYEDVFDTLIYHKKMESFINHSFNGMTLLERAVRNNSFYPARSLLNHPKLHPNRKNKANQSAFEVAMELGHDKMAVLLLINPKVLKFYLYFLVENPELGLDQLEKQPDFLAYLARHQARAICQAIQNSEFFSFSREEYVALLSHIISSKLQVNPTMIHPIYLIFACYQSIKPDRFNNFFIECSKKTLVDQVEEKFWSCVEMANEETTEQFLGSNS